jgi:hypothetical protein
LFVCSKYCVTSARGNDSTSGSSAVKICHFVSLKLA